MKRAVLMFLFLLALACGSSNQGQKVGETGAGNAPAAEPPKTEVYKPGDVVKVEDHTITLNEARIEGDALKANFTVDNPSAKEVVISSLVSFSAKNADGTKLKPQIMDCGTQMDGKVLAGDKLKGDICWKGAAAPVKIYYESNLFGSGAVVWEVK